MKDKQFHVIEEGLPPKKAGGRLEMREQRREMK